MATPQPDTVDGNGGSDTITYLEVTGPLGIDLGNDTVNAADGDDWADLQSVENAVATDSAAGVDTLVGDDGPNVLDGARGADTLAGAAGDDSLIGGDAGDSLDLDDTLQGGADDDTLEGGEGVNTADYSDDPGGVGIDANLATGVVQNASTDDLTAIQNVIGTSFDDTLTGSGAQNTLSGAGGNDVHNSQDGGVADENRCGDGNADIANADTQDTNLACETVNTPGGGGGGGGGGETPPADTTPPVLTLSGDAKQKSKKVKVDVTCDEACSVDAGSTIKAPKIKKAKGATAARKRTYDLPVASAELAAGATETLTLKPTGKAKKALKKALKAGKKSTANVSATAADAAGNQDADDFKVKVKKKRRK